MTSSPQLSLCVPVLEEESRIEDFILNATSFFHKFPLTYEICFGVGSSSVKSLDLLEKACAKDPHCSFKVFPKAQSRAVVLQNLLQTAKGEILIPTDLDLAVPFSEYFKILQSFFADQEIDIVFGNRYKKDGKKQSRSLTPDSFESFYTSIILEKSPSPLSDPFSPCFGVRKSAYEKLVSALESRGWYWTHEVQRASLLLGLKTEELPLYIQPDLEKRPQGFKKFLEAFHLLHFVLFRI